jgi:hypothetical protein
VRIPRRFFFYFVPPRQPEHTGYPHAVIALGEGLRRLGVELYSNVPYWQESADSQDTLFKCDPAVGPDDCAVVALTEHWFDPERRPPPPALFDTSRRQVFVYLDNAVDSSAETMALAWSEPFSHFDCILKISCCRGFNYPANVHPWAHGLSERMLREFGRALPYPDRARRIVHNFRPNAWKLSVREASKRRFNPRVADLFAIDTTGSTFEFAPRNQYEELMWRQTGRRHTFSHFEALRTSAACAAFGGRFVAPGLRNSNGLGFRLLRRVIERSGIVTSRIVEWDNWRFWESLAAGCLTFHLDLEKYGARAPVLPVSGLHYVGVDLDDVERSMERLRREPDLAAIITEEGREWVMKHYAPEPTAKRFLHLVERPLAERAGPGSLRSAATH